MGLNVTAQHDPVNDVELTPDEEKEAIASAIYQTKLTKYRKLEAERVRIEQQQREAEINRPWGADELYQFALCRLQRDCEERGLKFVVDDFNRPVLEMLSYYFTNDPRFEKCGEGFSLSKGLGMFGSPGRGKTKIMAAFSKNKRACYDLITCENMVYTYASIGHEAITRYASVRHIPYMDANFFYQRICGICYEDLGTEDEAAHFGNKKNVLEKVLLMGYERQSQYPFHLKHFTTNLSYDEIEEKYGYRIRSRIREMFNHIEVHGPDRRK